MNILNTLLVLGLFVGKAFADLQSCHAGTISPCEEGFVCKTSDLAIKKGLVGAAGACVVRETCNEQLKCPRGYTCTEEGTCAPPKNFVGGVCGTYANIGCQKGSSCVNNVCMPEVCSRPLVTGRCRALFRKWGYDPAKGECVEFYYGGCESNGNNFESKDACELRCSSRDVDILEVEDLKCSADVDVCPDSGAFIGRVSPDCEFNRDHCPEISMCTMDVLKCADGSWSGRIGANCEFEPCADGTLPIQPKISDDVENRSALDGDDASLKKEEPEVNSKINPMPVILIGCGAALFASVLLIRWRSSRTTPSVPHVVMDEEESSV